MKAARPHGPAARTAPPSAAGLPQAARSGPHNEARARRAPSGQLRPGGRRRSQSQSPPRWHSRPRTATCPGPTSLLLRASRTKRSARRPRRSRAQPSPARPGPPLHRPPRGPGTFSTTPARMAAARPPRRRLRRARRVPPAPFCATRTSGRQTLTGPLPAGGGSRRTPRLSPGSAARRRARSSRMRLGASRLAAWRWRAGPGRAGMAAGGSESERGYYRSGAARRWAGPGSWRGGAARCACAAVPRL